MSSSEGGPAVTTDVPTERPENIDDVDFSNYFSAYGFLYNQKEMLEDPHRMDSYYNSIVGNPASFKDKVVLDVGTGSGILAIWAAKAGAKKVYAIEATYMAEHARALCKANGVGDVVEVLQQAMEDVELPEKVDVIVSEWMGYLLLRESMMDSVIVARDRWLKPDGALFPSHATMYLAPSFDFTAERRNQEFETAVQNWGHFSEDLKKKYGVSMDALAPAYGKECHNYFYSTALWVDAHPSELTGPPVAIKHFDLKTLTLEELTANHAGSVTLPITKADAEVCNGVIGWFTTDFNGSVEHPTAAPVTLTTAPTAHGATHWGQQIFHIVPEIPLKSMDQLQVGWEIRRQKQNQRLLEVLFKISHQPSGDDAAAGSPATYHFRVD